MKQLGILTALIPEAACLVRQPATERVIPVTDGIMLYVCGIGPQRARQGVARLLDHGADALLSLGTAGGLDPALDPGDVVIPETVLHEDNGRITLDTRWHAHVEKALAERAIPFQAGTLLHTDDVIRSARDKRQRHHRSGAAAVDMESRVVAEEAQRHGIPALVVRVIVDTAETAIPEAVLRNSDAWGRPRILSLAGALFLRPQQIPSLLRLARCHSRAVDRLRQLGRELHCMTPPA